MPAICLYFQVHQPHRLRRYSVFDAHTAYLDDARNSQILRSVAQKCYLPATTLLLNLIHRHDGQLRLGFSLTGSVIEQFKRLTPEVLDLFTALARAAGLATHTVVGLNYAGDEEPGLYLHAWNLVAVDGHWLPVDPTAGIVGGHGLQIAFPSDSAGYLRAYAAFAGAELALVDVEYFNEQPAADTL